MSNYNYVAINGAGRKIRGEIEADNEYDLESRLETLGLDLIDCHIVKQKKASLLAKVKTKDMIIFCLHMEQLDKAGVPLIEALSDARDASDSPKLHDTLASVYESVKNGKLLSEAMLEQPNVFNEVFTGLIAAGEYTGNLSEAFKNLSMHYKWSNDMKRKVRKAISYPITLSVVLIGVISILMLFVVPQLIDFIQSQGFEIPAHTKALIAFSDFFGKYWYLVLTIPPILGMTLIALYKTSESFAYNFDKLMLKIPTIGSAIQKINLARFSHFFSILFSSGIDVLDSLQGGKKVVGNRVIKEAIELVHKGVTEGNNITESLHLSQQFPNLVIRMFKVGEDSGNMEESLENINFFYDREVNDSVDSMVAMIQPTMMIVLGGMIFWVIAAVFGPLYQSFSEMSF